MQRGPMSERDVSGFWENGDGGVPDRSVDVAPPPRSGARPLEPAETHVTEDHPYEATPAAAPGAGVVTMTRPMAQRRVSVAFTREQLRWLRTAGERRDLFAGDVFTDLLEDQLAAVRSAGVGSARRKRRGAGYVQVALVLSAGVAGQLDDAAAELGVSRARLARAIVDVARQ